MKESLRHEIKATNEGISEEKRQADYREKSRIVIQELKERLDKNYDRNSQRKKQRHEEVIEQYR